MSAGFTRAFRGATLVLGFWSEGDHSGSVLYFPEGPDYGHPPAVIASLLHSFAILPRYAGAYLGTHRSAIADVKLIAFLVLSSCLGNRVRGRLSGSDPRHGSYDRTYFRTMTNPGPSSSEHIEMESLLNEQGHHPDDDM